MFLWLFQSSVRVLDWAGNQLPWRRTRRAAHATGRRGEEDAYFYLRRQGYVMVARNFRSRRRRGEIDLVGWDGDVLCFIEVKTRTTHDVKPAEAAVDEDKRRELSAMAREYWRGVTRAGKSASIRFDIVSIYYESALPPQVTLFKNAFPMT